MSGFRSRLRQYLAAAFLPISPWPQLSSLPTSASLARLIAAPLHRSCVRSLLGTMSRALDHDTAASVKIGSPRQVYNDLVEALCRESPELFEIEFLGKSHPLPPGCNLLVDGNSIAIPKGKLVQAFLVARELFFRCRNDIKSASSQNVRNTTAVMLLMDPENLTAANERKRLIRGLQQNAVPELQKELERELQWVDSMLTARLHRHTKSPTLWDHRRWVLGVWKNIRLPRDIQRDLTDVILVSADRHARNYYAWLHMRWLAKNFSVKDSANVNNSKLLSTVLGWCLKNPGDTAGFSFLLFCISQLPEDDSRIDTSTSVYEDVLGLANSFHWAHESVWIFLRTLVASGKVVENTELDFSDSVESLLKFHSENPRAQSVLKAARDWRIQYGIKPISIAQTAK